MTSRELLALAVVAVPALAAALLLLAPTGLIRRARARGLPCRRRRLRSRSTVLALHAPGEPVIGDWLVVDVAGGAPRRRDRRRRARERARLAGLPRTAAATRSCRPSAGSRIYYASLYAFWAILLAVPLAGNLGAAWLLVEATTAASALLVGFSGKPRALEAGWKYLVLTSLGLGVALLGIVMLAAGIPGGGLGGLSWQALSTYSGGSETALVAYLLLLAGLAAKIGWAPVHNWLPDAHSEAPPPVSALLSAALLPAVLLVAWRSEHALAPVVGEQTAQSVLIGFGLASLAVAVPFLWRSLPWKRLLAYSSLEHMGVIALGIGFGDAARPRRGRRSTSPLTPSPRRSASTPRRRFSSHDPRAAEHAGHRHRPQQARARRDDGDLARRARRPAALAALRQRGADRRRRLPGRPPVGGGRDGAPARARLPRARPRADRDDRGRQPAARARRRSPACAA